MKYRKVSPIIWHDEKFRTFTDDGKLAFLFLLTHPAMTPVGAMRGTLAGLAAELGWPQRRLERALAPAIHAGMVTVNPTAAFVGLSRFLRHNPPDNPNVARFWVSIIVEHVPECRERHALVDACRAALTGSFLEAFDRALSEAFPQGLPEPLPQPLGQPSPQPLGETGAVAVAVAVTPLTPQGGLDWLNLLNREAGTHFKPSEPNLRPIRARIREGHTLAEAETVVRAKVAEWRGTDFAKFLRPPLRPKLRCLPPGLQQRLWQPQ